MQHNCEIYSFAIDVLDGEPDVHQVLADLFEEQGDRGLAQWARGRKNTRLRRLDLTIALIPGVKAVELAYEFVEHVALQMAPDSEDRRISEHFTFMRKHIHSLNSVGVVSPVDTSPPISTYQNSGFPTLAYAAIRDAVGQLRLANREHKPSKSRNHDQQASVCVRKAARLAREVIREHRLLKPGFLNKLLRFFNKSAGQSARGSPQLQDDELTWQIDRTRDALKQLLMD